MSPTRFDGHDPAIGGRRSAPCIRREVHRVGHAKSFYREFAMRPNVLMIAVVAGVTGLMTAPVAAENIEIIAPFDLPAFSSVGFGPFLNDIIPEPHEKILAFIGTAQNPSAQGSSLSIYFDYIDTNGMEVIVGNVPANVNPLAPDGAPILADQPVFAYWTLDFCPELVSVHFEASAIDVNQIQGDFKHFCVPEPGSAALLALASGVIFRRRRGRR